MQTIERREYKYLVDEATAAAIREAARPFCALDSYAANEPGGRYTIDSLYFDTHDFRFFAANQHELVDRIKLRIRTYPASFDAPVFLEVKRRCNDVISKTRAAVLGAHWQELLRDPMASGLAKLRGTNRAAAERFLALLCRHGASPVMLIRYEREAWVSQIDHYARVTFDRRVRSQVQTGLSFEAEPGGWRAVDAPALKSLDALTVVELKFTTAVPRWLVAIVQSLNLFRQSFSKYGNSILTWHSAPTLMRPSVRGVAA
jgi:hypothetical protein